MQVTTYDHQTGFSTVSVYELKPVSNLERVSQKLTASILNFFDGLLMFQQFSADDLRESLRKTGIPFAPNSPYRIMYELKKKGKVNYRLVSRAKSLYEKC